MERSKLTGHLAALLTIVIWGTTFISTKVLLADFRPVEILFFRFVLGLVALAAVYPHRLRHTTAKQEGTFALAGLCGVCMYYLLENIALTYTMASNVGVIISVAPFFTALLSRVLWKEDRLTVRFFLGFALAIAGIYLVSMNGVERAISPKGDILALLAALMWACYSVLTKKISGFGYPTILTTRRVFAYGILFMVPALFWMGFRPDPGRLADPVAVCNLLYLGLGASALCFVTWNYAVRLLGAVKTSVYIYMVPVITVGTSMLILQEKITPIAGAGIALTLAGLGLSQGRTFTGKRNTHELTK